MSDLMVDIQEDIALGILSFASIAKKYHVPLNWVNMAWDELCQQEAQTNDSWYDDKFELADE